MADEIAPITDAPAVDTAAAPAASAGDTGAAAPTPPSPVEAFARGVTEKGGTVEGPAGAAPVAGATGSTAEAGATGAAGDTGAAGATGATAAPGATGSTAAPGATGATGPERDPEIEKEIKARGLAPEGDTANRLRGLSSQVKELHAVVEPLKQRAQMADVFEQEINRVGANAKQLQGAFGYLEMVNSDDPVKLRKGLDAMLQEVKWIGEKLGITIPGIVDPMAAHPDVAQQVATGQIDQPMAQEIVRLRAQVAMQSQGLQQHQQVQQGQAERQQALSQVTAMEVELRRLDPHFEAKKAQFMAAVPMVQRLAPREWAGALRDYYLQIPNPVSAPAPAAPVTPPIGNMPLRPTGTGNGVVRQAKDMKPVEAFMFGVEHGR